MMSKTMYELVYDCILYKQLCMPFCCKPKNSGTGTPARENCGYCWKNPVLGRWSPPNAGKFRIWGMVDDRYTKGTFLGLWTTLCWGFKNPVHMMKIFSRVGPVWSGVTRYMDGNFHLLSCNSVCRRPPPTFHLFYANYAFIYTSIRCWMNHVRYI